jgi:hypothetical protein
METVLGIVAFDSKDATIEIGDYVAVGYDDGSQSPVVGRVTDIALASDGTVRVIICDLGRLIGAMLPERLIRTNLR